MVTAVPLVDRPADAAEQAELGHARAPDALAELCSACPVRRLGLFRPMDTGDVAFARRSLHARRRFAPEADILQAGELGGGPYTLWEGWAYRHRDMPTGTGRGRRRQIVELLLPGDVFGAEAALTGRVGSGVRALTAVTVCVHDPRVFGSVVEARPLLARALLETAALDAERADARLAAIGQGTGAQRAAYLMLETRDRLAARGMVPALGEDGAEHVPFPLQRRHLAAALGMSGTHVTRSLIELEGAGMAKVEGERLVIWDARRLASLSGYGAALGDAGRRATL